MPQACYQELEAQELDYSDCVYLDPATHTKIEEVGAANFFGITKDGQFITPQSPSILPSITKYSLLQLAEERLGLKAVEGISLLISWINLQKQAHVVQQLSSRQSVVFTMKTIFMFSIVKRKSGL